MPHFAKDLAVAGSAAMLFKQKQMVLGQFCHAPDTAIKVIARIIGSIVNGAMAHLVKFYNSTCGTCGKMAHIDHKVAAELELGYVTCKVSDIDEYIKYRHILLLRYPTLDDVGYPTYVLVDDLDSPVMIGALRGGFDKGDFRRKLQTMLANFKGGSGA